MNISSHSLLVYKVSIEKIQQLCGCFFLGYRLLLLLLRFLSLSLIFDSFAIIFFFFFLELHPKHMEVLRPGVQQELQMSAYTTAIAMWDLSCICILHHSSQQCCILNPLSKVWDQTCILMDTSHICFYCATTGTPEIISLICILTI